MCSERLAWASAINWSSSDDEEGDEEMDDEVDLDLVEAASDTKMS